MSTVSVCMAAYNGERHIEEQLRSILTSPRVNEVIVSDDGSTDETWQVVSKISDPRVLLVPGPRKGLIKNFDSLL
jgi:glycosyltransferase involved in cell wall biosynthesis